jgi:hypothetical protein
MHTHTKTHTHKDTHTHTLTYGLNKRDMTYKNLEREINSGGERH